MGHHDLVFGNTCIRRETMGISGPRTPRGLSPLIVEKLAGLTTCLLTIAGSCQEEVRDPPGDFPGTRLPRDVGIVGGTGDGAVGENDHG